MAYKKSNPNGQATMANSEPVVIASDQSVIPVSDNSGSLTVDNAGLTELAAAINASSQMDVNIAASGATVPVSNAGLTALNGAISGTEVQVDVLTLPAIPAGNNNIGDVDIASIAAGDNNIGNVDVVTLPSIPAGTNNIGDVDILSIAAGDNNIGNVDIASIAAGDNNIGNVDVVTLPALAAGTNAVGKLLPPNIDVTGHTNYAKKYYTSAGAVTDGIIWSPAAGTRWHITSIYIQTSAAATITLEDDLVAGDAAIWKSEFTANQGVYMTFDPLYPWASGEDAADLIITTTAGNVYVTVVGYEI